MKTRWIVVLKDGVPTADKLYNHLKTQTFTNSHEADGPKYIWMKEKKKNRINYVCYHNDKQVGFIPLEWDDDDFEMDTFWEGAEKKGLETLGQIQEEIMSRHFKRVYES